MLCSFVLAFFLLPEVSGLLGKRKKKYVKLTPEAENFGRSGFHDKDEESKAGVRAAGMKDETNPIRSRRRRLQQAQYDGASADEFVTDPRRLFRRNDPTLQQHARTTQEQARLVVGGRSPPPTTRPPTLTAEHEASQPMVGTRHIACHTTPDSSVAIFVLLTYNYETRSAELSNGLSRREPCDARSFTH